MSLHIEGRRWFQRTYGNTYHTVTVYANGAQVFKSPKAYGYGDQWIQTALDWLRADGSDYLQWDQAYELLARYPSGNYMHTGTIALREILGASYSCIDVPREKDL